MKTKEKIKVSEKTFIANKGLLCPICNSSNIIGYERHIQIGFQMNRNPFIVMNISCINCGSYWTETYELKGISELFDSDNEKVEIV
jgi:hypothetical protein